MAPQPSPQVFTAPTYLNITAITAQNNRSIFECWQLQPGFSTSTQPGTAGASSLQLGGVVSMSYSVLPPSFNAGLHNAPALQWVSFLSGVAHITFPDSSDQAYVVGGENGLIFAADTSSVSAKGHLTNYPSNQETRVLQIPTGGTIPNHTVLHSGPCICDTPTKRNFVALDDLD
ncbi:hypothetical protein BC827DRAFT_1140335 [Russula dissimulans]|nr:hypothetical protein BC827DRAFT_1140335 [Russula dissimulans]